MSLGDLVKWQNDFEVAKRLCVLSLSARDALAASILIAPARPYDLAIGARHDVGYELLQNVDTGCSLIIGERRIGDGLERAFREGWNGVEEWGCWTSERHSHLLFTVPAGMPLPMHLDMRLSCYLPLGGMRRLRIRSPSQVDTQVTFEAESGIQEVRLMVRQDDVSPAGQVEFILESSSLSSPSDVGADDHRALGIALHSLAVSVHPPETSSNGRFDIVLDRGTVVSKAGDILPLLGGGWSYIEDWGVWGKAKEMDIGFNLPMHLKGDVRLGFRVRAYLPNAEATVNLVASLRGTVLGRVTFANRHRHRDIELVLPEALYGDDRQLRIMLQVDHLRAPLQFESSLDDRELGIGLEQVRLD